MSSILEVLSEEDINSYLEKAENKKAELAKSEKNSAAFNEVVKNAQKAAELAQKAKEQERREAEEAAKRAEEEARKAKEEQKRQEEAQRAEEEKKRQQEAQEKKRQEEEERQKERKRIAEIPKEKLLEDFYTLLDKLVKKQK